MCQTDRRIGLPGRSAAYSADYRNAQSAEHDVPSAGGTAGRRSGTESGRSQRSRVLRGDSALAMLVASARRAERGGDASVIVAGLWPARAVRNRGQANRQPPPRDACLRPKSSPDPQGTVFLPQACIPRTGHRGRFPASRCDLDERLGYHIQVGGAVRTPSECLRTYHSASPSIRPFCCQSPEKPPMIESGRNSLSRQHRPYTLVALAGLLAGAPLGHAQLPGLENGEWRYLGGDAGNTRSAPLLEQIQRGPISPIWRSPGSGAATTSARGSSSRSGRPRSTLTAPFTRSSVSGARVVSDRPATGETLWTFREPETTRFLRSPRADFGKGVAYAEVDGRGVIFVTSPAFFLWALTPRRGCPWKTGAAPCRWTASPSRGLSISYPIS